MSHTAMTGLYWVPGVPHLLRTDLSPGYQDLARAMTKLADDISASGAERILYYSTQWLSVLGVSFQAGQDLRGEHVDENWHDLVDSMPFHFKVDLGMAETLAGAARKAGFQPALINYAGFPVDTGTIVADRLLNQAQLPVNMVSSHVYADASATRSLAQALAEALAQDAKKTAVVVVSGLSGFGFTEELDLSHDRYRDESYRALDEKLLALWQQGRYAEADGYAAEFAQKARADMGLKAYHFMRGFMQDQHRGAQLLALAPVNGQGAAVVKF